MALAGGGGYVTTRYIFVNRVKVRVGVSLAQPAVEICSLRFRIF